MATAAGCVVVGSGPGPDAGASGWGEGASLAFSIVATVFFLRFWRDSGDRLFAKFAASIAILGIERIVLFVSSSENEGSMLIYLLRLVAFLLIVWAMIEKNRGTAGGS